MQTIYSYNPNEAGIRLSSSLTDNLGSILSILDRSGESVYEATYDVWGQQEVTLNEIGFHRGYTGHEMLPEFGIINMNGRLYDPMLGRFLSPDNYVQSPTNSQNFNRYSYCLNNPLKYNDPSGNIFGLDDAFFAFAVFGIGSSMMQAAAFDQNVWKAGAISALCSFGTYGIGSACSAIADAGMKTAGVSLIQAGAHGLNSGLISALNGDNYGRGFVSGMLSSGIGTFAQNVNLYPSALLTCTTAMGGVSEWATGGNFLQGALRGMQIGALNHGMHLNADGSRYYDIDDVSKEMDGGYVVTARIKNDGIPISAAVSTIGQAFTAFGRQSDRHACRWYSKATHDTKMCIKNTLNYTIKLKDSEIYKNIPKPFLKAGKICGKAVPVINGIENAIAIKETGQVGWGNVVDFSLSCSTFSGWGALVPVGYTVGDMIYYRNTGDSFRNWLNRNWGSIECDMDSWLNY